MSETNNSWATESVNDDKPLIVDELTEVQKVQIQSYVQAVIQGEVGTKLAALEKKVNTVANALNVILACLEEGIPVKGGKVTLGPEEMGFLTKPKLVN